MKKEYLLLAICAILVGTGLIYLGITRGYTYDFIFAAVEFALAVALIVYGIKHAKKDAEAKQD